MDYFFLVPKIIAAEKYINVSRDDIERALNAENGQVDYEWEEAVEDDFHTEHFIPLRLNISCRTTLIEGWTISLKMHSVRIDGIDWHSVFIDANGAKQRGWHRHEFSSRTLSADGQRWATNALVGVATKTDFLIRTLKEMKILLSGVNHGNYELFPYTEVTDSAPE